MTEKLEVYKCSVCGNIVTVLHNSFGTLVCCNKPMDLLKENTVDASTEKHVPVIEKVGDGVKVKVGSVPHPMEPVHYIEWVEIVTKDGKSCIKFLKPGDAPEAIFKIDITDVAFAREYCNLHGLWKSS
ncbi:MAG: desulfoferrodoxin [Candidatus Bilamarchaeaceae archaeon]